MRRQVTTTGAGTKGNAATVTALAAATRRGNGNGAGTNGTAARQPRGGTTRLPAAPPAQARPRIPWQALRARRRPNVPQCPDVFGTFDIVNTDGSCVGVDKNTPQEIKAPTSPASRTSSATRPVNGGAALDENGDFAGEKLYSAPLQRQRAPASGTRVEERMTVKLRRPEATRARLCSTANKQR